MYVEIDAMRERGEKTYAERLNTEYMQREDVYGRGYVFISEYIQGKVIRGSHITPFVAMQELVQAIIKKEVVVPCPEDGQLHFALRSLNPHPFPNQFLTLIKEVLLMANHIKIPKDLDNIREKFMFGLTKRQCLCFAIAFILGIPVYFLVRKQGIELGILAMGFTAAPAIICGIYKKNGLTFEKSSIYQKVSLNM